MLLVWKSNALPLDLDCDVKPPVIVYDPKYPMLTTFQDDTIFTAFTILKWKV